VHEDFGTSKNDLTLEWTFKDKAERKAYLRRPTGESHANRCLVLAIPFSMVVLLVVADLNGQSRMTAVGLILGLLVALVLLARREVAHEVRSLLFGFSGVRVLFRGRSIHVDHVYGRGDRTRVVRTWNDDAFVYEWFQFDEEGCVFGHGVWPWFNLFIERRLLEGAIDREALESWAKVHIVPIPEES
jgi:hypothetical protein